MKYRGLRKVLGKERGGGGCEEKERGGGVIGKREDRSGRS
jgi:hypothetical protein